MLDLYAEINPQSGHCKSLYLPCSTSYSCCKDEFNLVLGLYSTEMYSGTSGLFGATKALNELGCNLYWSVKHSVKKGSSMSD